MLRLITDFDGPIVDVSERYYSVYQYCLNTSKRSEQAVRQLSKSEFWQLKRSRIPERQIGLLSGLDEEQAKEFALLRRRTVHSLPYLVHDRLLPGVRETLEKLQYLQVDVVVMTMRRVRELETALESFDLHQFFPSNRRYCLSNEHQKSTDVEDKTQLMKQALQELPAREVWMVGDTEADIVAAKTYNVRVIGVLSGIRDRLQLERYEPDFIVNNFSEAVALLSTPQTSR
ncbi:MAG: HAD family hydrolase [Cyanophyceae cyanobacterium]